MFDLQNKFKRQAEILGLALSENEECNTDCLLDLYNVEPLTIKRDLKEIRMNGIDIHSSGRKGIEIINRPSNEKLKEIIIQYLALCKSVNSYDKSVSLMLSKLKEKALCNIIILQLCIEKNYKTKIYYQKELKSSREWREICPLMLFESENYWRVLAVESGVIKQFHLNKILKIKRTENSFKPIPRKEIEEMFVYSWKSWLGSEKYDVKLCLTDEWASKMIPRGMMVFQDLRESGNGCYELNIKVNNLDEIASWIVSRGEGVTVIEPPELKEKVLQLAMGALKNYNINI